MTAAATKIRYDGSACLNVRSLTSACALLASKGPSEKPLKWADLASVLWFVETSVTSKKLFFDGTVPRDTVDHALEEVDELKRRHDLKLFEVSAIVFDHPEKTLAAAGGALEESRLLLEQFAIDPGIDTPLDLAEHQNFVHQLGVARALPEVDREELALTWVTDAFRGSKCLAGLIAAGDSALNSAYTLYQKHGDQGPLVTSALINRFRLNYVNQLASQRQSAYVPDPAFETLTREHFRLFKDYLIERIVKKLQAAPDEPNILVENMRAETPLPPIGLYALMATRTANYPAGILETAYNEFRQDDGLMRVIWQNTKGGIALKKERPDDVYASEIEHYFYDHYKTLEKEAEGIKLLTSKSRTARTYLVPAVLKGLAKAIPEVLGAGSIVKVLYSVLRETGVEASIPFLSDRLLGEGCDSYISQYKSLKWDLQHDDSIKTPLAKLSDQVERVFRRKLA
jgi:hypothetical protein